MSTDVPKTLPDDAAKASSWDWIWPTIIGVIVARLFGIAGGLVIFGVYYWLKPKMGVWRAFAASSLAGVCFAVGIAFMLENFAATPTKTVSSSENHEHLTVMPSTAVEEQQRDLLSAAAELSAKYPQLDPNSPMADQGAIDYVVFRRDAYAAKGHAIDIALRMAVNDYADQQQNQQQREADRRYEPQTSSNRFSKPVSSGGNSPTWYEQREARLLNECQPKGVMTDEEMARCRNR